MKTNYSFSELQDNLRTASADFRTLKIYFQSALELTNPDDTAIVILQITYNEIDIDSSDFDNWERERDTFERTAMHELQEFFQSNTMADSNLSHEIPISIQGGHYIQYNQYGDSIEIHSNDASLILSIMLTGQY